MQYGENIMRNTRIILVAVVALVILALLLFVPRGRQASQGTRYVYGKPAECLTRDNKRLVMSFNVSWHIADAGAFAKSFPSNSPSNSIALAQHQLNRMIYSAGAEVAGQHNLSDFVSPGGSETTLGKIEKTLQVSIEGKLDKNSGIMIESVRINNVKQL